MKTALAEMPGTETHVVRFEAPPGWVGEKHSHQGHVFVYIIEGALAFELDGKMPISVRAGEAFHELLGQVMRARNPSTDKELKFTVFQLNPAGQPLMIKAE
jgi:quercetin dioxygenase-like cupin family protein